MKENPNNLHISFHENFSHNLFEKGNGFSIYRASLVRISLVRASLVRIDPILNEILQ